MALELVEDARGDVRNAQFLAMASDLAYLPEAEAVPAFREKLGLEAKLLSVDNTQAYVAQNDDHIVVAFRGTEGPLTLDGLKDWFLTDALNLLMVPEGRLGTDLAGAGVGARFHKGFVSALGEIWEPTCAAVEAEMKRKERPLWLTGHSLGGALALLAGWMFTRKFISVHQVYTFGAPMIGNAAAAEAFDKALPDKVYRYVNISDPVPKLPTISLIANDYGHCLKEIGLGNAMEEAATALAYFKSMSAKNASGVVDSTLACDLWNGIKERLAAHGLDSYRKLLG